MNLGNAQVDDIWEYGVATGVLCTMQAIVYM